MPLIKHGRIAADPFQPVADGAALPGEGPILIGLARWQEERGLIEPRNTAIGVRLKPAEAVDQLVGDLDRLALVVLEFPKFNDGRAFSQARLLRQRYGYKGEIRATGRVLRDQLLFMHRSGFDAYEVGVEITPEILAAAIASFSVVYQPAADGRSTANDLRHRLPASQPSPGERDLPRGSCKCAQ
ncbi:MAG TPA: DUF934 domain-containing protein [Candidatus Udaeobacter sp.]|nr:DUF934 domain-containing protein [Candidatus Udaeobacter sp.]